MIVNGCCDFLARSINGLLRHDEQTLQRLQALEQKWVAVDITDLELTLYFGFSEQRILVQPGPGGEVCATLSGRSVDLFLLGFAMRSERVLKTKHTPNIRIEGDVALGMALQDILKKVDLPLERITAEAIGPGPAYWLGALKRGSSQFLGEVGKRLEAQGIEFIRDELGACVTRQELNEFSESVAACRDHLARIEAKLKLSQRSACNPSDVS